MYFLIGLAKFDKPVVNAALRSRLIIAKADDDAFSSAIIQVTSANGKLVVGLDSTTTVRLRAVLAKSIEETTGAVSESKLGHPTQALGAIVAALPVADLLPTYQPELDALFAKRAQSTFVIKVVKDRPELLPIYFSRLLDRAGSYTFEYANSFANALDSIDKPLAALLSDEQAFKIIVAVVDAARWGAWAARGVTSSKFSDAPLLRAKAIEYIGAEKEAAVAYAESKLTETMEADEFISAYLTPEEEIGSA